MIANDPPAQSAAHIAVETAAMPARAPARPGFSARFGRALREDTAALSPRRLLADLLTALLPRYTFHRLRTAIYRRVGGYAVGRHTLVFGRIDFNGPGRIARRLRIGAGCCLNTPLSLDLNASITIGDNVSIGHHVVFITAGHEIGPPSRRCGKLAPAPIVVEDGCWIGAGATIMPGVTIGAGSVVSVGSLVAADVPPNKLVAGVPARPIKSLSEEE